MKKIGLNGLFWGLILVMTGTFGCDNSSSASGTATGAVSGTRVGGSDAQVGSGTGGEAERTSEADASSEPGEAVGSGGENEPDGNGSHDGASAADGVAESGVEDGTLEGDASLKPDGETSGEGGEPLDTDVLADGGGTAEGGVDEEVDLADLDLNGEIPQSALPVTAFIAENHDGGTRTEANLIGKPTVMWFFPFAGTPG